MDLTIKPFVSKTTPVLFEDMNIGTVFQEGLDRSVSALCVKSGNNKFLNLSSLTEHNIGVSEKKYIPVGEWDYRKAKVISFPDEKTVKLGKLPPNTIYVDLDMKTEYPAKYLCSITERTAGDGDHRFIDGSINSYSARSQFEIPIENILGTLV